MSRRLSIALALACALACAAPKKQPSILKSGGALLELSVDKKTLTLVRGTETLLRFNSASFQIGTADSTTAGGYSFDPYWLFIKQPDPPEGLVWRAMPANQPMKLVSLSSTQMALELDYSNAKSVVTFTVDAANEFKALMVPTVTDAQGIGYLRFAPDADATEGFYGMGEWGDTVNNRGKLRPMQIEAATEVNLESGYNEDHAPIPLLLGTRGWGMFVKSKRPGTFGVATNNSTQIDVVYGTADDSAQGLEFYLFTEAAPLDLIKHYYGISGPAKLPAPWALGPWFWRDDEGTTPLVQNSTTTPQMNALADMQQIRTLHLAFSGFWFDRPYASGVETFDFKPSKYPDPAPMFQSLHDAGFRYAVWNAPYTANASNGDPAPVQLAYATANNFFPPVVGPLATSTNKWGKAMDFTNPAAYAWWQMNLGNYTNSLDAGGYGIEGFKLDYGEDVAIGILGARGAWQFFDGSTELTMHYGYQLLYHKVYGDLLPSTGGFLLTRTARWGDQANGAIIWPGDLDASFAQQGDPLPNATTLAVGGLPSALMRGLTLSASGFAFYASDTGGYRSSPAPNEAWIRWAEANSVQIAMEVGDASSEAPWEFTTDNGRNQQSLNDFQKYASLHMRLFPYSWTYAQQIATTGRPVMRPFGLAWPNSGQHPNDEYMFGDSILVAPVVAAGLTSRPVLLPPGKWIGWWDGATQDGGTAGATITAAADLDTLPLYIAEGGIVPMLRASIDTLAPATMTGVDSFANDAGVLNVRVAPGATKTSFTLYDGTALMQQTGSVSLAQGSVFVKGALFEVIATPMPTSVMNGSTGLAQETSVDALNSATDAWFWDGTATGGTLWIKVAGNETVAFH